MLYPLWIGLHFTCQLIVMFWLFKIVNVGFVPHVTRLEKFRWWKIILTGLAPIILYSGSSNLPWQTFIDVLAFLLLLCTSSVLLQMDIFSHLPRGIKEEHLRLMLRAIGVWNVVCALLLVNLL